MDDYHHPQSSFGPYDHNVGAPGLDEIDKLAILCELLGSLGTDLNVLNGTVVTTPELPYSLPTITHNQVLGSHQDEPWNEVGRSINAVDKRGQSQWDLAWWLVQKINAYRLMLQHYDDLRHWLETYERSKDIISDGLHALEDISHKRVPDQFNNILCAMLVQQAVSGSVFARKKSLLGDINESAFSTWGGMIPAITETNQKILDTVFERLTSSDRTSSRNNTSWSPNPSLSELGSGFPTQPLSYPMTIGNSSLNDPPPHEHLPSNSGFNPSTASYSIPPFLNQASTFDGIGWDANGLPIYNQQPNINDPYFFDPPNQYHGLPRQPLSPNLRNIYQPSNFVPYGAQTNPDALYLSNPFRVFKEFMNDFKDSGDLLSIFSHDSIRESNNWLYSNERQFYMNAKSSFFGPLETSMSQLSPGPIARAIVSTTLTLVSRGKLHSFQDTADYMVHLSQNLLSSRESCASFARVVLETCYSAIYDRTRIFATLSSRDQNNDINQRVEEIASNWSGTYHPAYLLQRQDFNPKGNRSLRPRNVSRASSTLPTLSSLRSNDQSYLNTTFEDSTTRTTVTAPSLCGSTIQCPSCEKSFTGKHAKSHLSRHKRDHRDVDTRRQCPFCDKVFQHTRTDNIRTHCRNVHQQELPKNGRKYWGKKLPSEP